jgi:hypothetical protein
MKVGLAWVGLPSNDFYGNASLLAFALGFRSRNAIGKNFNEHTIRFRKSSEPGLSPCNPQGRRQGKLRYHPAITYECKISAAKEMNWAGPKERRGKVHEFLLEQMEPMSPMKAREMSSFSSEADWLNQTGMNTS